MVNTRAQTRAQSSAQSSAEGADTSEPSEHQFDAGMHVLYRGNEHIVVERSQTGSSYKLRRLDAPTTPCTGFVKESSLNVSGTQVDAKPKHAACVAANDQTPTKRALDFKEAAPAAAPAPAAPAAEPKLGPKKISEVNSTSIGYAEVASIRLGPKGPLPTGLGKWLWGGQEWRSPKSAKKQEQLSVRLIKSDRRDNGSYADTFVVDVGGVPMQVAGSGGGLVDFAFPLSQLSSFDVHNGRCKLEFLHRCGERNVRGGPLVVLDFHEKGVLTAGQWNFVAALSKRLEKLGQKTADDGKDKGVHLGLPGEVEWLPPRYTSHGRWWLRVLLVLFALFAFVPAFLKLLKWSTQPLDAFAEAMQGGVLAVPFQLAHWLFSGAMILNKLAGGVNKLVVSGKAVVIEESGCATIMDGLADNSTSVGKKKQ